jgi:hypothetical protein
MNSLRRLSVKYFTYLPEKTGANKITGTLLFLLTRFDEDTSKA